MYAHLNEIHASCVLVQRGNTNFFAHAAAFKNRKHIASYASGGCGCLRSSCTRTRLCGVETTSSGLGGPRPSSLRSRIVAFCCSCPGKDLVSRCTICGRHGGSGETREVTPCHARRVTRRRHEKQRRHQAGPRLFWEWQAWVTTSSVSALFLRLKPPCPRPATLPQFGPFPR